MEAAADVLEYLNDKKEELDASISSAWAYDRDKWNSACMRATCQTEDVLHVPDFARRLFSREELDKACTLLIDRTTRIIRNLVQSNLHIRTAQYDDLLFFENAPTETVFHMTVERKPSRLHYTLLEAFQRLKSVVHGVQGREIEEFTAFGNEPHAAKLRADDLRTVMKNAIFIRLVGPEDVSETYAEFIKR